MSVNAQTDHSLSLFLHKNWPSHFTDQIHTTFGRLCEKTDYIQHLADFVGNPAKHIQHLRDFVKKQNLSVHSNNPVKIK